MQRIRQTKLTYIFRTKITTKMTTGRTTETEMTIGKVIMGKTEMTIEIHGLEK